ncbi:ABC transporter substrate-binding protein [Pseudorhodoplanes sp.]|uniref:ABC transporter substrate-binding protein n=1 Tax=Pseudorhodoplanes sp. TaxID=1934341 RepID=UPI002C24E5EA|nr:ABC transporter substrate-binding protein [Pseudorhodoplanes sp.]HWV55385.1 ABC transporter substrate-binding protein [Pseudorhodoplanes sp.]
MKDISRLSRRQVMATLGAVAATIATTRPRFAHAQTGEKLRFGMGTKSMNATTINMVIGEALGYNKQEGFSIEPIPTGAIANVQAGLDKGDFQFGVGAYSFALPLYAKKQLPPIVSFYEYTYPYKWDIAVLPDSPIKSYGDLRGKKIGVSGLGTTDYPVSRAAVATLGIDPDKDVQWLAVGEGVTAGVALQRGAIDALAYFDTGFGQIESAGIKTRMLPRPEKIPMIGGFFVNARRDYLEKNRKIAVGFGRSGAKASEFILANPQAGAKVLLEAYPELAPRGASQADAIKAVLTPVLRRMQLFRPPYPNMKLGQISEDELHREAEFLRLDIKDFKPLYTNELIDEINNFDRKAVIDAAKAYKI